MKYKNFYQYTLIAFALLVVLGIGFFVYHELFPEYKEYQDDYIELEKFRSTYTHEDPAPFTKGIKQILLPNPSGGPEKIDRCISCHVAMDLPHFSPTRPAVDVNDQQIYDASGNPLLEPNPDYVWSRLDQRIADLNSSHVNEELKAEGKEKIVQERLKQAERLAALKKGEKVIQMHPLLPGETRPFQFHPMAEYGCTTCHSGNGRALEASRAHGPVYDGDYDPCYPMHKPQFTEQDPENDPLFAKMYNCKPAHDLVFQTTPILAGSLIAANCVQCHQGTSASVGAAVNKLSYVSEQKKKQIGTLKKGLANDQAALASLNAMRTIVSEKGREGAIDWLSQQLQDYQLSSGEIGALEGQLAFLKEHEEVDFAIESASEASQIALEQKQEILRAEESVALTLQNPEVVASYKTSVDRLTAAYQRGKELFISQACYACHRIAGYSRASVGPDLTKEGNSYPWYVKESIVWPQADLPSSTMPNFRLDHDELSDLMTFLMAQKGDTKAISAVDYHIELSQWEKGAKMPWEKPVAASTIRNVREGQVVFASEGCAACHQLQGFSSNAYFNNPGQDKEWFLTLFPENIQGSDLAVIVSRHAQEIDQRILIDDQRDGIIEEIESRFPGLVSGFYTPFKFAARAIDSADQDRLRRVLLIYIQEYGLGREIAPHLSWSGIFRSDEWLLGHFHNPPAFTAKSIMPVMPFDDTKFYMLNHMLHVLAVKNQKSLQEIWRNQGFSPALAYEQLCSSCHGDHRQGNGPIAEWIYPIPKNLRDPVFLSSLTKERAIESITHGVRGTPMPPWGEAIDFHTPVLNAAEINQLVDWLYQGVPYDPRTKAEENSEKWHYSPADVVVEMKKEKHLLQPAPPQTDNTPALVDAYFLQKPNAATGPDRELFYIRDTYYTSQNLEEAKQFFMVNCATCHGNEGTGAGLRATSMVEAKPRMFTNLPWIRTRDDLRLLRAIKYGVPGTAMTPWGDQTTSAQRMQLVMFIRDLTRATLLRGELDELLYAAFDSDIQTITQARIEDPSHDILYQQLIELLKEEKELYSAMGSQAIAAQLPEEGIQLLFNLVKTQPLVFNFSNGKLELIERTAAPIDSLLFLLNGRISALQSQIDIEKGKISSQEVTTAMQQFSQEQAVYINLRTKLLVQLADAAKLRTQQKNLFHQLYNN